MEGSISSLIAFCDDHFQRLLDSCSTDNCMTQIKATEERGRLRVWAGNFGAFRSHTDRLSLDHRLQSTPLLRAEVVNQLTDLSDAIQSVVAYISEKSGNNQEIHPASAVQSPDDLDSDSSDSDEFWEQLRLENAQYSGLDEYLQDINHTITSLYKFSLALQNPASADRESEVSQIAFKKLLPYDIRAISNASHLPEDNLLVRLLGTANNKRRSLLAHYKKRSDETFQPVDDSFNKSTSPMHALPKGLSKAEASEASLDYSLIFPAGSTPAWAIFPSDFESIEIALDGDKKDSIHPNNIQSSTPHRSVSRDSVRTVPFFCPHCHQSVELGLDNFDEEWRKHWKADVKPYICTFGSCVNPNQLYENYEQWSCHERQFHRREWFCGLCSYICTSKDYFAQHIHDTHSADLPHDQQEAILKLSERAISSPQQCPLCMMPPISDPTCFQRHLGLHLEHMSHFILQDLSERGNRQKPSSKLPRDTSSAFNQLARKDDKFEIISLAQWNLESVLSFNIESTYFQWNLGLYLEHASHPILQDLSKRGNCPKSSPKLLNDTPSAFNQLAKQSNKFEFTSLAQWNLENLLSFNIEPTYFQWNLGLYLDHVSHPILQDLSKRGNCQKSSPNLLKDIPSAFNQLAKKDDKFDQWNLENALSFNILTTETEDISSKPHDNRTIILYLDKNLARRIMGISESMTMPVHNLKQESPLPAFDVSSMYSKPTHTFSDYSQPHASITDATSAPSLDGDRRSFTNIQMPFDEWKLGDVMSQVTETYYDLAYNDKCTNDQLSEAIRTLDRMKKLFASNVSPTWFESESSTSSGDSRSGEFQCRLCDRRDKELIMGSFASLKRHLASFHDISNKYFICTKKNCGRSFDRSDRLREHVAMVHRETPNEQYLRQSFVSVASPITCPLCDCEISSWDHFFDHFKEHCYIPPGREGTLQP